jgi:hypothetical protein
LALDGNNPSCLTSLCLLWVKCMKITCNGMGRWSSPRFVYLFVHLANFSTDFDETWYCEYTLKLV